MSSRSQTTTQRTQQKTLQTYATTREFVDITEWSEPPRDDQTTAIILWGLTVDEFDNVRAGKLDPSEAREIASERETRWRELQ